MSLNNKRSRASSIDAKDATVTFIDKAQQLLKRESLNSMGLVFNSGLFEMEKGHPKPSYHTEENSPLKVFTPFMRLLSPRQGDSFPTMHSRMVSYIMDITSYLPVIREVSLKAATDQTGSAAQRRTLVHDLSRAVLMGLLSSIDSRKVNNGFALVQSISLLRGPRFDIEKCSGFLGDTDTIQRILEKKLVERILVVSWDSERNVGLQKSFYDNPNVLCISLHRDDDLASAVEVGIGSAMGKNVNIPLPPFKTGAACDLLYALHHIVLPIATQFQPDLVIVPTSFDFGALNQVLPEVYAHFVYALRTLASGKIIISLECFNSLEEVQGAVCAVAEVLMGASPRSIAINSDQYSTGAIDSVAKAICIHAPHWSCLEYYKL